jgi:hypothetical protein
MAGCLGTNDLPDPVEPEPEPWPCGSTTWKDTEVHSSAKYEWDEHHNLVREERVAPEGTSVDTWIYDDTGKISVFERHDTPRRWEERSSTVVDGLVTRIVRSFGDPGSQQPSVSGEEIRTYNGRNLVRSEITLSPDRWITTMTHEAWGRYDEEKHYRYDTVNGSVTRRWSGNPWTEMTSSGGDTYVPIIQRRTLDVEGRELAFYSYAQLERIDRTTERRADGAPVRETEMRDDFAGKFVYSTVYTSECQ